MVAVAFVSAKGSPGCTTTALALSAAWPDVAPPERRVLLAECDPAGGDIASGYLQGNLDGSRGVVALAGQRSTNPVAAVWQQVLALDDDSRRLLLPGLTDPRQALGLGTAWSTVSEAIGGLAEQHPPVDVLVDLGRLHAAHEPVLLRQRTDLVVLVTRSSLPAAVAARAAAVELSGPTAEGPSGRVGCLIVGEGQPYSAKEISEACALPVIGVLPYDPVSAATFSMGAPAGKRLPRSPLMRSARALATALLEGAVVAQEVVGAGRG